MVVTDVSMSVDEPHAPSARETAELARGGRTSFLGYVLRLAARFPFLFIAGRMYGAEALGRFAYATMVVELVAMFATLGLKRGLAEAMAARPDDETNALYDSLLVSLIVALVGALLLVAVPQIVFPSTDYAPLERWFPLIILAIVASDISLAGLAYRFDIGATVRARSLVEPWVLSIAALGLAFTALKADGLIIAYLLSMVAAVAASLKPAFASFGAPQGWRPRPALLWALARRNMALAGADIAEWGARKLDIFILGRFVPADIVGIYFIAQQIASLPARLKSSFDPILAPVLATNIAEGRITKAALHIRQIGFWVGAAQLGVVLALGITGQAIMGLFGPIFAGGVVMLALLLLSELFAAQAAVAEAALVYVARARNLAWSAAGITIQAGLSLLLVPRFGGEGAAAALAASALILSVGKSRLLARLLAHPVAGWRWSLLIAGAPAFLVGLLFLQTPEWVQLGIGQWVVLGVFGVLIWRIGFKGADRLLFARSLRGKEFPAAPDPVQTKL